MATPRAPLTLASPTGTGSFQALPMTERLQARWQPGTTDRILVRSPHGELEWFLGTFQAAFGPDAVASLYLTGHADLHREGAPLQPTEAA